MGLKVKIWQQILWKNCFHAGIGLKLGKDGTLTSKMVAYGKEAPVKTQETKKKVFDECL